MKTIPLRQLVREPIKVKRWTRAGQSVQVTDNGAPLWIIHPAAGAMENSQRQEAIEEVLEEVLRETPARYGAAQILEDSRR